MIFVSISEVSRLEGPRVGFPHVSRDQLNSSLLDFTPKSPAFASEVREESKGQRGVAEKAQTLNSQGKALTLHQLCGYLRPNLRFRFLCCKIRH